MPSLFLDVATPFFAWAMLSSTVLSLLIPIAIANAVLRHRLYDIDRIVKRTLVYGALTALLAAAYTVPVFVLGQLLDPLEQRSRLSVATSTLLVAALFHPARRRIQGAVDRRFDRTRYDAAQTIENFASRLRHEIELDALQHELLAVVRHAMHPTAASLWLNGSTTTPKP